MSDPIPEVPEAPPAAEASDSAPVSLSPASLPQSPPVSAIPPRAPADEPRSELAILAERVTRDPSDRRALFAYLRARRAQRA